MVVDVQPHYDGSWYVTVRFPNGNVVSIVQGARAYCTPGRTVEAWDFRDADPRGHVTYDRLLSLLSNAAGRPLNLAETRHILTVVGPPSRARADYQLPNRATREQRGATSRHTTSKGRNG